MHALEWLPRKQSNLLTYLELPRKQSNLLTYLEEEERSLIKDLDDARRPGKGAGSKTG